MKINLIHLYIFSVVRLIQQYLKESNLNKTLQTLQVNEISIEIDQLIENAKNKKNEYFQFI